MMMYVLSFGGSLKSDINALMIHPPGIIVAYARLHIILFTFKDQTWIVDAQ